MTFPAENRSNANRRGDGTAGFIAGVGDVWRGGFFLFSHPRLWPWAVMPFLLNAALFGLIIWGGWHFFGGWIDQRFFARGSRWWNEIFGWLLRFFFWIANLIFAVLCFVPIAGLVASPFNDVLSDKVERLYAGSGIDQPFSIRYFSATMWTSIQGSLWLAVKTYGLMALALPLYLLPPPIGGIAGSAAQAFIAIRYLALQYTAYSMDRRLFSTKERERFRREHHSRTLGLGAMSFVVMTVPLINAAFIPISAIAGTLLFCDTELRRERKS